MKAEKQNYDFHDVDTAQQIARDGRSGTLELERAAQILDGEVDRLGTELDAARARVAAVLARCDEIDEACQQHVHRHIYTQTVRELLTGS